MNIISNYSDIDEVDDKNDDKACNNKKDIANL